MNIIKTHTTKNRLFSLLLAITMLFGVFASSGITLITEATEEYIYETVLDYGSEGWAYKQDVREIAIPNPLPEVDATWTTPAKLPLGYGNGGSNVANIIANGANNRTVSERGTTLTYTTTPGTAMPGRYGTAIAQRTIDLSELDFNLDDITRFEVSGIIDDGLAILINGQQAVMLNAYFAGSAENNTVYGYRRSMVVGDPFSNTDNSQAVYKDVEIPKELFVDGVNTITLLMLNDTPTSSDIFVDIKLVATDAPAPPPEFKATNFIMSPGKTESEINFLWHSPYEMGNNDIYFTTNTATETQYMTITQGAINGAGGRFHDGTQRSTYRLPLGNNTQNATLYLDISQNYTIELSGDATTWGDIYYDEIYPGGGEGNRHIAEFDLKPFIDQNSEFIYFRIGDRTPTDGHGGIIYSVWLKVGGDIEQSGSVLQYEKTADLEDGEFTENSEIIEASLTLVGGSAVVNKVTAEELELNTEYTYRYGDEETYGLSEPATFHTGGEENKVIFVTDVHAGEGNSHINWNNTLTKAMEKIPDARYVVMAGDIIEGGRYDLFKEPEGMKNIPLAPVRGNHDYNESNYKNQLNLPNMTNNAVTGGTGDFYFSYGNTLYVMLNTNRHMGAQSNIATINTQMAENLAEHRDTFEKATESHPDAKWVVAMFHHDVYGTGDHAAKQETADIAPARLRGKREDNSPRLTDLLDEYNVDIVLNGHEHLYSRSFFMKGNTPQINNQIFDENGVAINPNGILYITGGPAGTTRFRTKSSSFNPPWLANHFNTTTEHQFIELDISDDTFTITNYSSQDSRVIETYTIKKQTEQDKEELGKKLREANQLRAGATAGADSGQYPQAAITAFDAVISTANDVYFNENATEQEIVDSTTALTNAIPIFKTARIPFKITYSANGADGEVPTETDKQEGEKFTVKEPTNLVVPTGKLWNGWNTAANGTGTKYESGVEITVENSDITLFAQWADILHTVTFHPDGGTPAPAVQTRPEGQKATEPPTMTKPGFVFDGWYKESEFTTKWDFENDTVTAATDLYAKWNVAIVQHTITFNRNYTGAPTPLTRQTNPNGNFRLTEFPTVTRTGWRFTGWFTAATGGVQRNLNHEYTGDTTLFARWVRQTYTVTFRGGKNFTKTIIHGNKINLTSAERKRAGFTYIGVFTDSKMTRAWNNANVTSARTLYIKWERNPTKPTNVRVAKSGTKKAKITWKKQAGVVFEIQMRKGNGKWTSAGKSKAGAGVFTTRNLQKGRYTFRVRATKRNTNPRNSGYTNAGRQITINR